MVNEEWECRNCLRIVVMDIHGRCPYCQSTSLITQHIFPDDVIVAIRAQAAKGLMP